MKTRFSFFLLLYLLFGFSFGYSQEKSVEDLEKGLKLIQNQWRPDWRLGVFEWSLGEMNGQPYLNGKTTSPEAKQAVLELLKKDFPHYQVDFIIAPQENAELNDRFYGVVTLSVINLRYDPDYSAELGTQALLGMPVRIIDKAKNSGWIRIQMPNGYLGYTTSGSVQPMTKDEYNSWISASKIVFTDFFGFVYSEPDKDSSTISDLVAGNVLTLENSDNELFYQVAFPDGRIGWILKESSIPFDIWLATRDLSAENVTKTAKKFLGFPYFWAGTSTKGIDCSGFVSIVFFLNRIIILRDASQQMRDGINIDVSEGYHNLKPGDLLYFGTPKSETNLGITHTGIYLGDSEFIHAATSVKINSLDPNRSDNFFQFRTSRLVKATRLIDAPFSNSFMPVENNPFYQPVP
ncbi:MAG: NlpC/P60 family protein [Planctomycetia bacterium]|nr:NlpC/P60 family protein [Planctomycetia bacterium]